MPTWSSVHFPNFDQHLAADGNQTAASMFRLIQNLPCKPLAEDHLQELPQSQRHSNAHDAKEKQQAHLKRPAPKRGGPWAFAKPVPPRPARARPGASPAQPLKR